MAKNSIRDYSATASSNTDIQSVNIDENCPASGINNALREILVDLKNVSTGAVALETPAADSLTVTGDLTVDTTTLKVDSTNNRVGIGTTSPSSFYSLANNLVVGTGSGGNGMTIYSGSGDSGYIGFNDTASASMQGFIQYNHNGDYMAFAPNGSEKMRLNSSGQLLINDTVSGVPTALAAGLLHIDRASETGHGIIVENIPQNYVGLAQKRVGTAGVAYALYLINNGNQEVGTISFSNTGTAYNTTSDYRLKTAVTYDWDATSRIKQLKPARFEWIADGDDAVPVDGFLAHEAATVVPESVIGTHNEVKTWTQQEIDDGDAPDGSSAGDNKLDEDGNTIPVMQGIDQSKLVPLLTKALIEAVEKIEQLEARITALETA